MAIYRAAMAALTAAAFALGGCGGGGGGAGATSSGSTTGNASGGAVAVSGSGATPAAGPSNPTAPTPEFRGFGPVTVTSGSNPQGVAVARLTKGASVVVWATGDDLVAQRLDADGGAQGSPVTVATVPVLPSQRFAASSLADGGFVVAWTTDMPAVTPAGIAQAVHARRFGPAGDPLEPAVLVSAVEAHPATGALVVRGTPDGGHVVGWTGAPARTAPAHARFQRYSRTGAAIGGNVEVHPAAPEQTQFSLHPLPDGSLLAAWAQAPSGPDATESVLVRRFSGDSQPLAEARLLPATTGATGMAFAATALSNGQVALAWHRPDPFLPPDAAVQVITADGDPAAEVTHIDTGPFATGLRALALGSQGFAFLWQNERAWNRGSSGSISARRFDSGAVPQEFTTLIDRSTGSWSGVTGEGGSSGNGWGVDSGPDGHLLLAYEAYQGANTLFALGR